MKTSDTIDLISAAIVAAQGEAKHANFDSQNPHFKSKYASLPEVIDAMKGVLAKHELAVMQMPEHREEKHYLTTRVIHKSGQWIETEMMLNPVKNDPQGVGSSITYGKRYSLTGILCIASEEDDDGNAASYHAPVSALNVNEIKAKVSKINSKEEATKYWRDLRLNPNHPQYTPILAIFKEANDRIAKIPANDEKAAA